MSCLNKIVDPVFNKAGEGILTFVRKGHVCAGITFFLGVVFAPVVSLVALPLFAIKALPNYFTHKKLYNLTVPRVKLGRIEGQDYTRWDGRMWTETQVNNETNRLHEQMNRYVHGLDDEPDATAVVKLKTHHFERGDYAWLKHEYTRRKQEDLLDHDLKMIRAFGKALIPLFGFLWVLGSETGAGGASQLGCQVCRLGSSKVSDEGHWSWKKAINFHLAVLEKRFPDLKK